MTSTPPAFFKVFMADSSDQQLKIPPSFVESLEKPLPEEVHLNDKHGNEWTMRLGRAGPSWLFLDGWARFRQDNELESGDLLFFEYQDEGRFNVLVLGTHATEKEAPRISRVPKPDEIRDLPSEGGGTEGDYCGRGRGTGLKRDYYGLKMFEAGVGVRPVNPYFVTKVRSKRPSNLFIPREVVRDYDLKLPEDITLVDPRKREFRGKVRRWGDDRVVISGGWRTLWRMNLVAEDDRCICEFLLDEKLVAITFVRAAELRAARV